MWKLCFVILESMGGRYVKFLLLGYIFFLWFKTLAAVWMQLSADTQALNGDFPLESLVPIPHHLQGWTCHLKNISVFQGSIFYSLFLEGFQFLRPVWEGGWPLLTVKFFFSVISLNYSGVLILLLLGIHRVRAYFPLKTVFVWNKCSD